MTQADSVHSTPRITASKINPPVDPTRRRFLTVAAGGSIAGLTPAIASAVPADPIYAAIEKHGAAAVVWDAAVDVWAKFPDGPEWRIERERIHDAWCDARNALDDVAIDLINTAPTTLAGIARALNYIREQMVQKDSIYMPSGLVLKDDDDPEIEIIAWIDAFLDTIEHAASELDRAGKAVQS
jgi:hypothetical protein